MKPMFLMAIIAMLLSVSCSNEPDTPTAQNPAISSTVKDTSQSGIAAAPEGFKHVNTVINGINIHYVTGGAGEPLVLLHGFGQNWFMWNRILPELAKHFTIVAPDLPGLGESGKPDSGYEKKHMARYIHGLVENLGFKEINLAGHDIGLMVAYAYAAQFPSTVKKLALMDALLPGIEPVWSQVKASAWWFGFFAFPASGQLVEGQERLFLTNFWPMVGYVREPFTKEESDEFIRAYSVKGATTAAFHWFGAFEQDAKDNKEFMKTRLKMPLLAMGGEHFGASFLVDHCKLVADDVRRSDIKGSGHWIVQENTEQVRKDLLTFFTSN
jgi:pimeloyl-ACP methyl ester carboxylesterase